MKTIINIAIILYLTIAFCSQTLAQEIIYYDNDSEYVQPYYGNSQGDSGAYGTHEHYQQYYENYEYDEYYYDQQQPYHSYDPEADNPGYHYQEPQHQQEYDNRYPQYPSYIYIKRKAQKKPPVDKSKRLFDAPLFDDKPSPGGY